MLQIQDQQLVQLRSERLTRFEDRLVQHAREHLRQRCAHLDDAALRKATRRIVQDAQAVGLRSEHSVALYFNVAVYFGMDFLKNERIAWAMPIAPMQGELLDPAWMVRVSETARLTLKKMGS